MYVNIMLSKVASRNVVSTSTSVMPSGEHLVETVQGIICYPKLGDFNLPLDMNYQKYMARDEVFSKMAVMVYPSHEYNWLMVLLHELNALAVDKLCQFINQTLYICLSQCGCGDHQNIQFQMRILKEMQKGNESCFEDIFRINLPIIYEDSVNNRRFRYLIINWLKNKFVNEWMNKVVIHMRTQIQTSISSKETDLNDKRPIVLNDNDVNRMFGWALFKVKKKYKKWISQGWDNKFYAAKSIILDDMTVVAEDIMCNEHYVRMYYPLDDRLRNEGRLTLIHPNYCKQMSELLKNITRVISNRFEVLDEVIPNKDDIITQLEKQMVSNDNVTVSQIITLMKERNPTIQLQHDGLNDLVWELIGRVLNALVGDKVKKYRNNVLFRGNNVAFRTDLAVKSEKRN